MRTIGAEPVVRRCSASRLWTATAASTAEADVSKATKNPSPVEFTTSPPWATNSSRSVSSCQRSNWSHALIAQQLGEVGRADDVGEDKGAPGLGGSAPARRHRGDLSGNRTTSSAPRARASPVTAAASATSPPRGLRRRRLGRLVAVSRRRPGGGRGRPAPQQRCPTGAAGGLDVLFLTSSTATSTAGRAVPGRPARLPARRPADQERPVRLARFVAAEPPPATGRPGPSSRQQARPAAGSTSSAYLTEGITAAMIGTSGWQVHAEPPGRATAGDPAVREDDDRGRRQTTHREGCRCPPAACWIDSPVSASCVCGRKGPTWTPRSRTSPPWRRAARPPTAPTRTSHAVPSAGRSPEGRSTRPAWRASSPGLAAAEPWRGAQPPGTQGAGRRLHRRDRGGTKRAEAGRRFVASTKRRPPARPPAVQSPGS